MNKSRLFLIDANAFCYRAFYAVRPLSTSFGQPTNAIYGFLNFLNKFLKENNPEFIAACFDVSKDTFRTKKFAEYKIQRPSMPNDLVSQIPLIKQVIKAYGITLFEKEGYEADDIIATLSRRAKKDGISVTILSSDKDMLQLVDGNTQVFSPNKDAGILYDETRVVERFSVTAKQVPDIIALMGDSADNIPNVPGVGEVFAKELIKTFGTLDSLLKNIDKVKQDKIRVSLMDNIALIRLNKELVLLEDNVDIDYDLNNLKISPPDYKKLFELFKHLEFKKFIKDLPSDEEETQKVSVPEIREKEFNNLIAKSKELVLYGDSADNLVYCAGEKLFSLGCLNSGIKQVLLDHKIKKISHDLKKIKVFLAREGIILEGLGFDTMVAGYLLDPSKSGYALADIAWDHLGKTRVVAPIDNQKALELIVKLRPNLEKELQAKSLIELFQNLEMPLVEVLSEMELNGIKLDLPLLKELSCQVEKKLAKLIGDIYKMSGVEFNINSPKQLREILFVKLKLPVFKKTKSGPSTDEEVLRNLSTKHKLPELLLEYRQLTKLKTTYIDVLPGLVDKKTSRLHTNFNQTATETGRLSSSNPNLQNIPIKTEIGKQIRRAIISAGKNSFLLSCDYSQIELRILAHLSKDESLIAAFQAGKDVHKITASLIYGLGEADVTDQMRDTAKRVNFGIVYGLTAYGLARDLSVRPEESARFIDAYFLRYPGVKDYIQKQIAKAEEDGFVVTLLGRRRYIPQIKDKNQGIRQFAQRQAVNTPIQGSASDLIKLAMVDIHKELKIRNLKSKMVLQIHDELVFELPEDELEELTELVTARMENALKLDVPIRVDIKKGKNWLEMEGIK